MNSANCVKSLQRIEKLALEASAFLDVQLQKGLSLLTIRHYTKQVFEELTEGKKRMVQVRFKIDKEGVVSSLEIYKSGGEVFDKEVIRVCKKMPRWKPAMQNGITIPVSYVIPVTCIVSEQ